MFSEPEPKSLKKKYQSRFQKHTSILMWKSYLQRQRRWRLLVAETVYASVLFTAAVFIAKPVFLTPLQAEPEPPLTAADLLASLNQDAILGYAPDKAPYTDIMIKVAELLRKPLISAATELELDNILYNSNKVSVNKPDRSVIWVVWKPMIGNMWTLSIRSTERARHQISTEYTESYPNPHLRAGFLAVQVAVSEAIIEYTTGKPVQYEVSLVSMPVSPLMQEVPVKKALSGILMCFTLALIPPVLDTQALVVQETATRFKRGLRIRGVEYPSMYLGWLVYSYLTALPICFVAAISLLLIFRWIHLVFALMLLLAYTTTMTIMALIMAMFHNSKWLSCVWSSLLTLLQTYVAELLVHHEYDRLHGALTFVVHVLMPPLGLVNAMNEFALLQTGHSTETKSLLYSFTTWCAVILLYFMLLMFLQKTIGQERAIGGQVSWKSIIFKKIEDVNQLHEIEIPTGNEREKLQGVDELVAKAITFNNVSKSIMGVKVLDKITMDIYRGEFTMLFAERIQDKMINTLEDLLTGLTYADRGSITVLGHKMRPSRNYMTQPHMMGYCHRASFLVQDLTVAEHFTLFNHICMWSESDEYIFQYGNIRSRCLMKECNLENVENEQVRHLDYFYQAQLCWAIAILLEPRIVILPHLTEQHHRFTMVIKDKIMRYKKYITLIKICFSSLNMEYSDRVFIFDSKVLCFGGTPAYMFFKYGREYRVRMTIRNDGTFEDESLTALLQRSSQAGATVRAHLGSLLILRLPTNPTEVVAALVRDLMERSEHYGMLSIHISVPDSDEVYRRAMMESRASIYKASVPHEITQNALRKIGEPPTWKRNLTLFNNFMLLKHIGWKYFSFHTYHRLFSLITVLSAVLAGIFFGLSLSTMLTRTERDEVANKLLHGQKLTMEFTGAPTTLVLRTDQSTKATNLASAYVLSEPNATQNEIKRISYTALAHRESLTEYLVTRAIDSPQLYVRMFAYGMDVQTEEGKLKIQALYSPLHRDFAAAPRSLAKVYTSLLRYHTNTLNASIQITDDPLALDLTPWMKYTSRSPLFLQFLLILVMSHVTLIPSMENGLIRHVQCHAMNFSPARYWIMLYICDIILYWILVGVMTGVMMLMMYLVAPEDHFQYGDLLVVPFTLILYGFASVPQAYLFSLGPRVALNAMTFIIVNILFGETTIIAKLFYGETLTFVRLLMSVSPLFNVTYAFMKIKQIFLYNSECVIFSTQNLCSSKILHKCCKKCGVLQECFTKRNYLTQKTGILTETVALTTLGVIFMGILMLIEYKVFQRLWKNWTSNEIVEESVENGSLNIGIRTEMKNVVDKLIQIKQNRKERVDTFGEYLLAQNITRKEMGVYTTNSVYLGLGKGEILALSGLERHGRVKLLELLAGLSFPDDGCAYSMSQWNLSTDPHKYAREVSLSSGRAPLPPWMTVYDALELLALLRGVPKNHVRQELENIINALEMKAQSEQLICLITQKHERTRLHFAAAVVGAPPVLILDEVTAHQKFSVRRSMYCILHLLRKRGHAVLVGSSSVEAHMPMASRLAIMVDGAIQDVGTIDSLVWRYSNQGYTVVLHLKDEVDVQRMFACHFTNFVINDTSEVLVNVQVLDRDLNWSTIFAKMEALKKVNNQVYSYIITATPIDYIYNSIINNEKGYEVASDFVTGYCFRKSKISKIKPSKERLEALTPYERKYDITKLKELPWSTIFHS